MSSNKFNQFAMMAIGMGMIADGMNQNLKGCSLKGRRITYICKDCGDEFSRKRNRDSKEECSDCYKKKYINKRRK